MNLDHISLGPTPYDEECAQTTDPEYRAKARRECAAYIGQLQRLLGLPPTGARFRVKAHPHDFGSYYDVVVEYDADNAEAVAFALRAESEVPAEWDNEARRELGI